MIKEYHRMELAKRILLRASSGLFFLKQELHPKSGGTDGAFSRSRYILISYYADLILNALLCLSISATTEDELFFKMKKIGSKHNLKVMFENVSTNIKKHSGILSITREEILSESKVNKFIQYSIMTQKGIIVVQDFIDVRYDFKKQHGEKDGRKSIPDEVSVMKDEIENLLFIVNNLKKLVKAECRTIF